MGKKWDDMEVEFLKETYPNQEYSIDFICKKLNRSKRSVMRKADAMYLKRCTQKRQGKHRKINEKYEEMIVSGDIISGTWKKEEDEFLKFAFPSDRYEIRDICVELKRSERSLTNRAFTLGLRRPSKQIFNSENNDITKICSKCFAELSISEFYKSKRSKDGYNSMCKKCKNELNEKSRINKIKERGW